MIPFQKGGKIPIFGLHLSNKQHIAFVFRLMQVYPLPDYISRNSEQRQRGGDDRDFPCPAILKPIIVESGSFPEILLFNHPGRSLQGRTGQRIAVIDEFVDIIMPYAKIALHNAADTKSFNYGFSNAIRMLNDLGVIKAEHRLDAQEIWSIHPYEGHDLETTVTHITIGG